MARKPVEGTVANNVLTYGTGGLNIDASRIGTEETLGRAKGGWGKLAVGADNYGNFNSIGITKEGGRWPANVAFDEASAEILDEQSGQIKGGTWNSTAGARHFNNDGKPTDYETKKKDDSTGGASRFFYVAKASKRDRNEGLEDLPDAYWELQGHQGNKAEDGISNKAGTGTVAGFSKNNHPTVKPTTLMRYLIKMVTPPSGTVLDPFTGSGSTGKAAILDGFDFVGIEMTEDYIPIIEGRLAFAEKMFSEKKNTETEKLF
jgi:site-specific DNA-methyltransferase (adenine-specific)